MDPEIEDACPVLKIQRDMNVDRIAAIIRGVVVGVDVLSALIIYFSPYFWRKIAQSAKSSIRLLKDHDNFEARERSM